MAKSLTIKPKRLEIELTKLETFDKPILTYEQYLTPPNVAANMLTYIDSTYGDICQKHVLDVGCGTGMLALGAALTGAGFCTGIDICSKALLRAEANKKMLRLHTVNFIQCDAKYMDLTMNGTSFDTAIMNPPFGTKGNEGIDVLFLTKAFQLNIPNIYSLHKRSTRKLILKQGKAYSYQAEVVAELKFNIDRSFNFHKKATSDIEVDLFKFSSRNS